MTNEITTLGLITLPLAKYARLTGDQILADAVIAALDTLTVEAQFLPGGEIWFEHPLSKTPEAINHANLYGAALAYASLLPNAPARFASLALGINRWFERFQSPVRVRASFFRERAVHWPYAPSPSTVPGTLPAEAMWKAGASIELPAALKETGLVRSDKARRQLVATILHNPVIKSGRVPKLIDPASDTAIETLRAGKNLPSFLTTWMLLNHDDLDDVIFDVMGRNPDLFNRGWMKGGRMMPMMLAHLILNRRLPPHLCRTDTKNHWSAYYRLGAL